MFHIKNLALSVLPGICLGFASVAFAQSTPEETVKEIVSKIKAAGSPVAIVEYVNWPKAFSDFPAQQKEQLKIKSADEMKAFFQKMLANPTETMRTQMQERMASIPADQQEQAKQTMTRLEEMMKAKEKEMKERISGTTYEVGEAKIEGDKATVKLSQNYNGEKKVEDIKLEKDGKRWLLPALNMVAQPPPAGGPGAPPPAASTGGFPPPASDKAAGDKPPTAAK